MWVSALQGVLHGHTVFAEATAWTSEQKQFPSHHWISPAVFSPRWLQLLVKLEIWFNHRYYFYNTINGAKENCNFAHFFSFCSSVVSEMLKMLSFHLQISNTFFFCCFLPDSIPNNHLPHHFASLCAKPWSMNFSRPFFVDLVCIYLHNSHWQRIP